MDFSSPHVYFVLTAYGVALFLLGGLTVFILSRLRRAERKD